MQRVRFCTTFDFARLAYAISGSGPKLAYAPHWLTHIEHDQGCEAVPPWHADLSKRYSVLRFDQRGCGLSDRDVSQISFEAWVRDLECVIDAGRYDRFALLGNSQGAAIAVEYAARHPERVTHLVLYGGYARGRLKRGPQSRRAVAALTGSRTWGRIGPFSAALLAALLVLLIGAPPTVDAETRTSAVEVFDSSMKKAIVALESTNDEHLMTNWKLQAAGHTITDEPRYINIMQGMLMHWAHHRGQLTVYLRLRDAAVPAVYGPSADEKFAF